MKKILALSSIFLLTILCCLGVYHVRKGFSIRRVQSLEQTFSATSIDNETQKILSQDFHYLGRGRQCFAFESNDQKYVLKFPRTDIYRLPFWARSLMTLAYQKKLFEAKEKRKQFIFDSFNLAQTNLQEITGILFSHLGSTKQSDETLTLIDALGFKHTLPMHSSVFILQEKHPLWTKAFVGSKTKDEQSRLLNALVDAIVKRAQKGILNRDRSFLRNYGFDGEKVYQIDVGSFFQNDSLTHSQAYQKSARDSLEPVHEWLRNTNPEMVELLNKRLDNL